jgi:hypothetical protein
MKCTSLSLPSGAGGGASSGHSIAMVRTGRHDHGEGDVEIFAHSPAATCAARRAQVYLLKLNISG